MRNRRISLVLLALAATGILIGAAAQLASSSGAPESSQHAVVAMNKADLVGA
ncbi:hypothetical protein ACWGF3_01710 [Streptomyces xanthophaeus]|uniref:Secreted protein n=1 Tax=Streptomyces xanthophaeus TaxID=67385 RepID=A0A919H3P3_9ACTN|nr:hypothetical protein [Streptomyces xanthophaeus]GHI86844.1 hypothetical protein Sxan_42080 [Streptomyces xanthophaeus]